MTAAHPLLPEDDLDVSPMDDAYLATLPPDVRAAIEAAEVRTADEIAQLVPHAVVLAGIAQQRIEALAAVGVDAADTSPQGRAAAFAAEQRIRARLAARG